jgi:lipopolysaccharide transport system permease protein
MIVIDRSGPSLATRIREYRYYRTLFLFLMLRDIRLRFRQTWLGFTWAIFQPVVPMLIFAAVFSRIASDPGGVPYSLFVFSGMAPWIFVANSVTTASLTFINNYAMISKIYFPRAILPAAVAGALTLDGSLALSAVLGYSWWSGYGPNLAWLLFPLIGAATLVLAMTAALAAASIVAMFRDLKNAVPFLVQLWMYASPVLYPVHQIPESIRPYAALNPMAGLLEVFRACLFGRMPDWTIVGMSAFAFLVLLGCTVMFFHSLEADLAERV